nr:ABC transporter permease [uncultured Acetatifactor sp.]
MFNLLRMDLYRMKRSKSVYVCFFTMLAVIFLCYLLVYLLGTPEGRKVADRIGMLTVYDSEGHVVSDPEMKMVMMEEGEDLLEDANLLEMFRDSDMRGGLHNILFGIAVALFVCGDYKGGSMKNIMALHRNRWPYIGSKLIAVGILDFLYLVLGFGFNCLMNLLFGNMLPFGSWGDILFYLAWIWPVTMAFAALIIALCVFTRSITIGVLGAVLGGSGLAVMMVSTFLGYFHLNGWVKYTLYDAINNGPSSYASPEDLRCLAIGLVFLVVYSVVSIVLLIRQDI